MLLAAIDAPRDAEHDAVAEVLVAANDMLVQIAVEYFRFIGFVMLIKWI